MSTEQLTGLQLAVKLLAQIGDNDSDAAIAAVHDLADERAQRLTLQHHAADLAQRVADLEKERAEMRTKYDDLLLALHGIGKEMGIPECDRSPYSITCGALERVNRLAEVEVREPVAWQCRFASDGDAGWSSCSREHYAMVHEETSGGFARDGYEVRALIAAAPEHKA